MSMSKELSEEDVRQGLAALTRRSTDFLERLRTFLGVGDAGPTSENGPRTTSSTELPSIGRIAAREILAVVEAARSVNLRLPASDAPLRAKLDWEPPTAFEFVRALEFLDTVPLRELEVLLEKLKAALLEAEAYRAEKAIPETPQPVNKPLTAELRRIAAIAEGEELESLTSDQEQQLNADLYDLDVLSRKFFDQVHTLAAHEADLCDWRKLSALSHHAAEAFHFVPPAYIAAFNGEVEEICARMEAVITAFSSAFAPIDAKPVAKEADADAREPSGVARGEA